MKTRKNRYSNSVKDPKINDTVTIDGVSNSKHVVVQVISKNFVKLDNRDIYHINKLTLVEPIGGKKRKGNWYDQSYLAVIASSMAFDDDDNDVTNDTDYEPSEGGKKNNRKSSRSRKKPYSLKKRVR